MPQKSASSPAAHYKKFRPPAARRKFPVDRPFLGSPQCPEPKKADSRPEGFFRLGLPPIHSLSDPSGKMPKVSEKQSAKNLSERMIKFNFLITSPPHSFLKIGSNLTPLGSLRSTSKSLLFRSLSIPFRTPFLPPENRKKRSRQEPRPTGIFFHSIFYPQISMIA